MNPGAATLLSVVVALAGCQQSQANQNVPVVGGASGVGFAPELDPAMDARMIAAAARGDLPAVRAAHIRGASVRARDAKRRTALIAASYGNHLAIARFLIAAGASVNAKDQTVQSPYLISAAEVGDDPRLLSLTIAHGARINAKDSFNGTALIRAADRGYPLVVKRLLREDIEVDHINRLGWTALHEAIILGDGSPRYERVVELLVDGGADVNLPSQRDGVLPLQHAQERGYAGIARILEAAGARRS